MVDLEAILKQIEKDRLLFPNEPGVLATVIGTAGSTYQKVGARCYIGPDGRMIGLIGGGCLEQDLRTRSIEISKGHISDHNITYDARIDDKGMADLAIGCNGVVTVNLSRITPWVVKSLHSLWGGVCGQDVVHLVHGLEKNLLGVLGVCKNGSWEWGEAVALDLRKTIEQSMAAEREGRVCDVGSVALVERVKSRPFIGLWGAGPDAAALGQLFNWLNWDFCHYDFRPGLLEELPRHHRRVLIDRGQWTDRNAFPDLQAWVIMSHHLEADRACLEAILNTSQCPAYIGLLGPKARGEMLLKGFDQFKVRSVVSPAGYGLGRGPQEIAVAIAAQIKDVLPS